MQFNASPALKKALQANLPKLRQSTQALNTTDIDKHLYIVDKQDTLIPYVPNRLQRDLESKLTGRDLVLKFRQGGVSTHFVAKFFKKAISQRARIAIMAHDNPTTQKLRRMAYTFWRNLPSDMRPQRGLDNATTTTYLNTQSEITIATAGSKHVGLGGTYGGGVHGSEVAYWIDPESTMSAIMQGVPLLAPIYLESTPHGAQGWWYERCMEALRGEGIWKLHFYEWWWDDDYQLPLDEHEKLIYSDEEKRLIALHNLSPQQIKWRRYKKAELHEAFDESYPEDVITCFRVSGGGVFTLNPHNLSPHTVIAYQEGYFYVAGLDWGQDNDYTALSIMRVKVGENVQEVYLNRWRRQSWASIRAEIIKKLQEYHVEKLLPERNSIGSVNIEDLVDELDKAKMQTAIQAFYTDQRSKDGLVKAMQNGLSEYGLCLLAIDYATNELRTYLTKQSANGLYSYEAPSGGHDDTNMARMLAYYGASQLWI